MRTRALLPFGFACSVALAGAAIVNGCGLDIEGTMAPIVPGHDNGDETGASIPDSSVNPPGPDGSVKDAGEDSNVILTPPSTVTIAAAGTVTSPTGNSQQIHLVHAKHAARWWLFTIDDTTLSEIKTYSSADFVTWTQGTSLRILPNTHSGVGGNFNVAYADIGGVDVVHFGMSIVVGPSDRLHVHSRGAISGSTIAFTPIETIVEVTNMMTSYDNPDGPAVIVTADNHAMDITGWAPFGGTAGSTGNACSYLSSSIDLGTGAWVDGFPTRKDVDSVNDACNAHMAIPTTGSQVVSLWESGDSEPSPTNVRSSMWNGSSWSSSSNVLTVFPTGNMMNANDWSAVRLTNGEIHAVRRTLGQVWEHRKLGGTSWSDGNVGGQAIPAFTAADDSGIALLAIANRMYLAAIDKATGNVMATSWSGAAWSPWATLESSNATRTFLSGFAAQDGSAAIIWTELNAGAYSVVGRRVLF